MCCRYTPETRDEIAHFALVHSIKDACVEWSVKLGSPLSESTVRNFIRTYKRFSIHEQEDMGKFATQHGLEKATFHFTNKLGFSVRKGQMRKFKKLYLTRLANLEALNETEDTKKPSASGNAAKRSYSNQMKEEIGHYAYQFGIPPAVQHFTEKLQFPVKESTVRKFRKQFIENNKTQREEVVIMGDGDDVSPNANMGVQQRTDNGHMQTISVHGGSHPIIATSAALNINSNNNNGFVYQHPYTINMNGGNGPNNLSSGVLPMNQNTVTFPPGSVANQGIQNVNYQQQPSPSAPVIMSQNFNQQQSGGGNNFQQQQTYGFSHQLVPAGTVTHSVPASMALHNNMTSPLTMTTQQPGHSGGLIGQQILHQHHHQSHHHTQHQVIQQQHQHAHQPQHHQQQHHHQQQQSQQHQLSVHQQQQHPQLLTTCYSVAPTAIFDSVSLTSEPLCLLKDSPLTNNGNGIQQQPGSNLLSNSVITMANSGSPVTTIALVPEQCMTIEGAPVGPSSGDSLDLDQKDSDEMFTLEYNDDINSPPQMCRKAANSSRGGKSKRHNIARRGNYVSYSPEVRAAIGKYAATHGNLAAVSYFKEHYKIEIPESTVRGLKDKYIMKKMRGDKEVTCLGFAQRGRPMRLGKYDSIVKECIQELIKSGEKVIIFST